MRRLRSAGLPGQGRAAWIRGPDGQAGVLKCCSAPSESGHAFSLFLPPEARAAGAAGSVWRVGKGEGPQGGTSEAIEVALRSCQPSGGV